MSPLIAYAIGSALVIGIILIGHAHEKAQAAHQKRQRELARSCEREAGQRQRNMHVTGQQVAA
ncbi:hypothetical protein C7446_2343 [Kushneria sinocarnis]|uniref:Uncharacterized protein n=1 Tax=Kushneria sinocarnis TaxID=595502 RepID=A0A420WVQ8_9GAMM|nr:hypothetical protein [Kushneria sinocarnis]RKR02625.1 hypothetical protein C7446_2343 [Kushneria sinocarnis]